VWLYLLLARGMFWRFSKWTVRPASPPAAAPRVAVVIPARDEAEFIGFCVRSLMTQTQQVFVVDDGSVDATDEEARQAGATVISGAPLPPGWSGKSWAVEQGIQHALTTSPEFLLLTDADIRHAPDSIASLVKTADEERFDLVSHMVKLRCETPAEKLLMPAFVFFFFMLYPPSWICDRRYSTAGAAGGCMLIRPAALERAGGIRSIRREIIDDCALARAVKRSGGRVSLQLTSRTVSLRSYGRFAEIGRMISRSAFNQLRHSTVLLIAAVLGLGLTYLLPPLVLLGGPLRWCGVAAWVLMSVAYFPAVRFFGLGPLWAVTLPLSALFYLGATVHSAVEYWRGRGGEWKGRVQDSRGL
jgi:hopene-associated glycosyltransferase HpnB